MTLVLIAGLVFLFAGWQRWNPVAVHIIAAGVAAFDTFGGANRVMGRGEVIHGGALIGSLVVIFAIFVACYWLARSLTPSPKPPAKAE